MGSFARETASRSAGPALVGRGERESPQSTKNQDAGYERCVSVRHGFEECEPDFFFVDGDACVGHCGGEGGIPGGGG